MRRLRAVRLFLLLLGVLLTAACSPINPAFKEGSTPAGAVVQPAAVKTGSAGNAVAFSGLLEFDTGEALPPGSLIQVEILDAEGGFYPANVVARTTMAGDGLRSPIPFLAAVDRTRVSPTGTWVLGARVFDGDAVLLTSQEAIELGVDIARGREGLQVAIAPLPDDPATTGVLAGTVSYRARVALPAEAAIVVELVDRTMPPYSLVARQIITTQGEQPPVAFGVEYDPAAIDPRRSYALDARILVQNKVAFLLTEPVGVLTLGKAKDQVALLLEVGDEALVDSLSAMPTEAATMNVQVQFRREQPLSATAVVQVEIVDPAAADPDLAVLARAEIPVGGASSPLSVDLLIEQPVDPTVAYLMVGRILFDGDVAFEAIGLPVLTQGAPTSAVALPMAAAGAEAARQRELALAGLTGQLAGQLLLDEGAEVDPAAVVSMVLREGDPGADRTLARIVDSMEFATEGAQPPIAWFFPYGRQALNPDAEYLLEAAVIVNDEVLWVTAEPQPVLTLGAPLTTLELTLVDAAGAPQAAAWFAAAAAEAAAARATAREEAASALASGAFSEYVIVPGDTLSRIAGQFGITLEALRQANPDLQGDLIRVGDTLRIPSPEEEMLETEDETAAAAETEAAPVATPVPALGATVQMTGTVTYRQRSALPAGALVEVQLIDVSSDPPTVVAQDVITTAGEQVPIAWSLNFTPTVANDGRAYGLIARIRVDGLPVFASTELTPAKTGGAWRNNVTLVVAPIDWTGGGPTPIPLPDWALTPTPEAPGGSN